MRFTWMSAGVAILAFGVVYGGAGGIDLLRGYDYDGGVPRTWDVTDGGISNQTGRVAGVRPIWIEGERWQGKPTRIFAWWGLPKGASAEAKVPAMVLVHGGGGTAFASWVKLWNDRGYAAIAMDTCGGVPRGERDGGRVHPRHPWSGPYGWHDARGYPDGPLTDQWPYQAVTAVIRCHTFLRSRPEVDAERTGLTGISWGGYLTSITMGVDHRFKFAAPVYGCGWYDLNMPAWRTVAGGGDRFLRWLENWDPKHFIGGTRCPVLRCNGNLDFYYTMEMTRRSTEALPKSTPSHLSIKHRMPHGHPPAGDPKEITAWADHYLKGAAKPLSVVETKLTGGRLTVRLDPSADAAVSAELLYVTDVRPRPPHLQFSKDRDWTIVPLADFTRGATSLSVDVPAAARIFFVNVKSASGLVCTSSICERKDAADAPAGMPWTWANPVIGGDWPDPTVWSGGDGWCYSAATGLKTVRRSADLVHWEDLHTSPLTDAARRRLTGLTKNLWAPSVVKIGDTWLLYLSLFISSADNRVCVQRADRPMGPFEYAGEVVTTDSCGIENGIDPYVLVHEGRVWMFFGSHQDGIHVVELAADGLAVKPGAAFRHVAGRRKVKGTDMWGRPGCYEGAYVLRRFGRWYLFCSGGKFTDGTYCLTVGRSDSIEGPYVDQDGNDLTAGKAKPILASTLGDRFLGPGHNGDVFRADTGRDYMFFHAHDMSQPNGKTRSTLLQELLWTHDGWPCFEGGKAAAKVVRRR